MLAHILFGQRRLACDTSWIGIPFICSYIIYEIVYSLSEIRATIMLRHRSWVEYLHTAKSKPTGRGSKRKIADRNRAWRSFLSCGRTEYGKSLSHRTCDFCSEFCVKALIACDVRPRSPLTCWYCTQVRAHWVGMRPTDQRWGRGEWGTRVRHFQVWRTSNTSILGVESVSHEKTHLIELIAEIYGVDIIAFEVREHYDLNSPRSCRHD